MQVTVVDYGSGNIGSVVNMLLALGHDAVVASTSDDLLKATKIILPGVGTFDSGMKRLLENGLVETLKQKALEEKTPMLGICLGMQLMTKGSEEGTMEGLGLIDAVTVRFDTKNYNTIRVPHTGWNTVHVEMENSLAASIESESRFYFVHGYHLANVAKEQIMFTTNYGYTFVSGVAKDNVFGVQFHPEKSHRFGMTLLKNFVENI